jgi:hypothetical protein
MIKPRHAKGKRIVLQEPTKFECVQRFFGECSRELATAKSSRGRKGQGLIFD